MGLPSHLLAQWSGPIQTNGVLTAYTSTCNVSASQIYPEQMVMAGNSFISTVNASSTEVMLIGLTPFTYYECFVTASTEAGTGPASTASAMTAEDAPSGPPRDFSFISISSTSITLTWRRPETPNGIISEYTLTYMNDMVLQSMTVPAVANLSHVYDHMVMNLSEAAVYEFELSATTGGGTGPNVSLFLRTEEDGMSLLAVISISLFGFITL